MVYDGLTSTFDELHMVAQNSQVARELGISRETQDAWAARSHERAAAAQDAGRFDDELVAVGDVTADEAVRRDTTRREARRAEAGLRPRRDDDRRQRARRQRRRELRDRLLRGVGGAARARAARDDPRRRATSPTTSPISRARRRTRARWRSSAPARRSTTSQRVEINEAFASVASNSTQLLGADEAIVNVNGGAVALGHPIGASGGRIVATMVHELRRSGGGLGLAAICSGGGQGDALLLEV